MSRSYLLLIAILLLLILAVGGFAYFKSTGKTSLPTPSPLYQTTPSNNSSSPTPAPTTPPDVINPSQNTLPLTLTSPKTSTTVTTPTITVIGLTAPNADVAVSDQDIKADATGKFQTTITLDEGDNDILIVASNETGTAEWEGTVTYTPQ